MRASRRSSTSTSPSNAGRPADRAPRGDSSARGTKAHLVRIGCSGWEYPHWRGRFYPPTLPRDETLRYYARFFDTVEINSTFYRLPPPAAVVRWRAAVPPGFVFAVKASRYLTHLKRLLEPAEPLTRLLDGVASLGPHLGPILYQLPPRWRQNLARLRAFLDALPRDREHAIEFRDPSWYDDAVFRTLEERDVALCLHDMAGSASPRLAVASFVYVRFHGQMGRYAGRYTPATLRSWADWLASEARRGRRIFAYFNNDVAAQAPCDARRLARLLRGRLLAS